MASQDQTESVRLVDSGWIGEIDRALRADTSALRVVSPFIKLRACERLFARGVPTEIQVITRFSLSDFADGVSDPHALRRLLEAGARIRGVKGLHAKLYLFGSTSAIVTSANLTMAALSRNHEFGFASTDGRVVARCRKYFDDVWKEAGPDLTLARVTGWEARVKEHLASGARERSRRGLGDEGADVALAAPGEVVGGEGWASESTQAFVKFFGEGSNRKPLSWPTLEEIVRAGCDEVLSYPAKRRPRAVADGAVMFIARLTSDPHDIRVFGRAIATHHDPDRDNATEEEIKRRDWRRKWPRYIRVHDAEFVAGTMANGVSLNQLMAALGSDSFASTQRNAVSGKGNTDPRRAYNQQAQVELTQQGIVWLNQKLEAAFAAHGQVPSEQFPGPG